MQFRSIISLPFMIDGAERWSELDMRQFSDINTFLNRKKYNEWLNYKVVDRKITLHAAT
jgi:hypothetical protein